MENAKIPKKSNATFRLIFNHCVHRILETNDHFLGKFIFHKKSLFLVQTFNSFESRAQRVGKWIKEPKKLSGQFVDTILFIIGFCSISLVQFFTLLQFHTMHVSHQFDDRRRRFSVVQGRQKICQSESCPSQQIRKLLMRARHLASYSTVIIAFLRGSEVSLRYLKNSVYLPKIDKNISYLFLTKKKLIVTKKAF